MSVPADIMGMPLWAAALGLAAAAVLVLPGLVVLATRSRQDVAEPATGEEAASDPTSDLLDRRSLRRARVRMADEDPIVAAMGVERHHSGGVAVADDPGNARPQRTSRHRGRPTRLT